MLDAVVISTVRGFPERETTSTRIVNDVESEESSRPWAKALRYALNSSIRFRRPFRSTRLEVSPNSEPIALDVPILETREPPVNQQIAATAKRLRDLGMTYPEIGERLGIDRWTVEKAIRWLQRCAMA